MSVKQGGNTIAGGIPANTLNYDNISNCITEIPQDIKLGLNNGTLTLKAGSKVYVPNGSGVFDEITIASDLSTGNQDWSSGKGILYYRTDTNAIATYPLENTESGSSSTLTYTYRFWYDTTNNVIKTTSNSGSTWEQRGASLPIAIVHWNKDTYDVVDSIDQIFNGFGYIGSTVFALPNVKGLIPNGRNEDGSLKNIEFVTDKVSTTTRNVANANTLVIGNIPSETTQIYNYVNIDYNANTNYNIVTGTPREVFFAGYMNTDGSVISNFQPKTVFHAVDYGNMVTTDTAQTISGEKTFSGKVLIRNSNDANAQLFPHCIEFAPLTSHNYGGYIDFHYAGSTADYTSRIIENSSGNINLDCTSVTAPATAKTNGIVTTTAISKSGNGYVKLGNGIIIQWGNVSVAKDSKATVTFPTAFSDTNYRITATVGNAIQTGGGGLISTTTHTATNFVMSNGQDATYGINWIAIGY